MGGRSRGKLNITGEGNGHFHGYVSLENNGGFSSIRHQFETKVVDSNSKFILHIKGDGKNYQFRVKTSARDRHSYQYVFTTTKEWQTVEIPFSEMIPTFRGYRLNLPNYPGRKMEEVAILIGNKIPEEFSLQIDKITLK